jgi:hypothetical protein
MPKCACVGPARCHNKNCPRATGYRRPYPSMRKASFYDDMKVDSIKMVTERGKDYGNNTFAKRNDIHK